MADRYPETPDGRYFIVRGRLWRRSDPALSKERQQKFVSELMAARRAVGLALQAGDQNALRAARAGVDAAKRALGERGLVWWDDGAPDYNRHMAKNTPYAEWYAALIASSGTAEADVAVKPVLETESKR